MSGKVDLDELAAVAAAAPELDRDAEQLATALYQAVVVGAPASIAVLAWPGGPASTSPESLGSSTAGLPLFRKGAAL
jgi:hypothetical protein